MSNSLAGDLLSKRPGARLKLGCMSAGFMVLASPLLIASFLMARETQTDHQNGFGEWLFHFIFFDCTLIAILLAAMGLTWAIFIPRWMERMIENHALKVGITFVVAYAVFLVYTLLRPFLS